MWDLYGKGSGIVAVTTTVVLLKKQLAPDQRQVFMAAVRYVDWSAPNVVSGLLDLVARKEISYAHEAEMRAFVWDISALNSQKYLHPEQLPAGLAFSIDPQELVSEVWVGPREKSWIPPIVEETVARYSLNIPVKVSNKLMNHRLIQSRPNLDT
jgi:hypothetical protein